MIKKTTTFFISCFFIVSFAIQNVYAENSGKTSSAALLMHSKHFMIMSFKVPLTMVQPLIPGRALGLADEQGNTNLTLEMYQTDLTSGIPNFKALFAVVDVPGPLSRSGIEPHMPIWGVMTNKDAHKHYINTYHYPYTHTDGIHFSQEGDTFQIVLVEKDHTLFKASMAIDHSKPVSVSGAVDIISQSPKGGLKSAVPFITQGFDLKTLSFDVAKNAPAVLQLIKGLKPQWAMVGTNQQFSYGEPQSFSLKVSPLP